MISISLFNNKGGVGKTTLTCNIAAHFARELHKRVLLVDCDPQCNTTQLVLDEETTQKLYRQREGRSKTGTLLDVVRPLQVGDAAIDHNVSPILASANRFGTDLLAGHPRLSIVEDILSQAWAEAAAGGIGGLRKSNWVTALCSSLDARYDIAFFDIGPSLGSLNRTVLLGTQYFMSPMGADLFSIFGIRNISEWLSYWLGTYEKGVDLSEQGAPNILADFFIEKKPKIKHGFVGYTVQQYITKSKGGVRRPTKAYERLLEDIPNEVAASLAAFAAPSLVATHLGDVPHMYSLVPLAQSVNAPIRELIAGDGLVGSQFKQRDSYVENLGHIVTALAKNLGMVG
ncbi:MAG TPA: ParA family protein [Candidatus Angelobacter sp.]|nr:ParA family protein [Candidatus Angelobacter sp.]